MAWDVFNTTSGAFTLNALTYAINQLPFKPMRVGELGWFQEQGVNTTTLTIEELAGVLSVLTVKPRGAVGTALTGEKRTVRSFVIPHIPAMASILADEVQNVRAFGQETAAQSVTDLQTRYLERMRQSIELILEHHRLTAVMGNYINAAGASTSLFTEFGVSQQTEAMALTTATTKLRQKVLSILTKMESALGGTPYSGVRILCGATFWSEFIEHAMVADTLKYQNSDQLRSNPTGAVEWGGVQWERYRGTSATLIPVDEAYAVPEGVPGLFLTRFGPADYNETVNTVGLPLYAKAEVMSFGKGVNLEAQSNALNLCTRPAAVIKLTKT